jgi:imidazolonepropionase
LQTSSGSFVLVNASELCRPELSGRGVERLRGLAVWADGGRIRWIGPEALLPADAEDARRHDCEGGAVLPALVDCHTHLVFAGDRIEDFSRRSRGMTYAEIAAAGGGIHTSVRATREASTESLLALARARLEERTRHGIGTTEVKSGYGLTAEHELGMLRTVRALRGEGWDLEGTLLAAHAVPKDRPREDYVHEIVEAMIPTVAREGLARFVDVFVEAGAYTADEARAIFAAARAHGLWPRLHADQLTAGGGAELAAEVGAASADHLEHVSEAGLAAMARAEVVAVLLPGALTYLGDSAPRLGRRLIDAGVQVAVATDYNPGSSPTHNLPLMATLAVTALKLNVEEALRAVTLGGALALRRPELGRMEVGARATFCVLTSPDSRALVASFGEPVVRALVRG